MVHSSSNIKREAKFNQNWLRKKCSTQRSGHKRISIGSEKIEGKRQLRKSKHRWTNNLLKFYDKTLYRHDSLVTKILNV
jgi:hypothetical protein